MWWLLGCFALADEPELDVVVIGAGPAGLAAAIEATDAGARTLVLEREPEVGGAARWSGGLMLFSGTPEQAGEDDPGRLLAEWREITGGDPEDPWVERFARQNVPDVHDWLVARGLRFGERMKDPSGGSVDRVHVVDGGGEMLVDALSAGLPSGVVRTDAEVVELASGEVTWDDLRTGQRHVTRARSIVVATGGFGADLDRVRREAPRLASMDLLSDTWPGADGRGLLLLEELGAATENLGAVGVYAHGTPDPFTFRYARSIRFAQSAMWVNAEGERFVDETGINGFATGESLLQQPDGHAWVVADLDTAWQGVGGGSPADQLDVMELVGLDAIATAPTLGMLAWQIGVPAGALRRNAALFGGPGTDRLDAPPFYAIELLPSVAKTFGGVDVDLDGRVLGLDGEPLLGLYAAGELTGMAGGTLVGSLGFTGSLSAVILGGRVAGATAAAEARLAGLEGG